MCCVHYDVIYHPFPINSQYLKTEGVDSPGLGMPGTFQRHCCQCFMYSGEKIWHLWLKTPLENPWKHHF